MTFLIMTQLLCYVAQLANNDIFDKFRHNCSTFAINMTFLTNLGTTAAHLLII
jgi:hypothetical protein